MIILIGRMSRCGWLLQRLDKNIGLDSICYFLCIWFAFNCYSMTCKGTFTIFYNDYEYGIEASWVAAVCCPPIQFQLVQLSPSTYFCAC